MPPGPLPPVPRSSLRARPGLPLPPTASGAALYRRHQAPPAPCSTPGQMQVVPVYTSWANTRAAWGSDMQPLFPRTVQKGQIVTSYNEALVMPTGSSMQVSIFQIRSEISGSDQISLVRIRDLRLGSCASVPFLAHWTHTSWCRSSAPPLTPVTPLTTPPPRRPLVGAPPCSCWASRCWCPACATCT